MSKEEKEAIDFFKSNNKEYSFRFDISKEKMLELKKALGIEDDGFDFKTYSIRIKALLSLINKQQAELDKKDKKIKLYENKLKKVKKYIKENYYLLHFCEGLKNLMYYKDFKKFRDDILKILKGE